MEFAQPRRDAGASWKQIATELGLRFETVRRWCESAGSGGGAGSFKRVEIVEDTGPVHGGLCVVCPSGHRIEGLTLEDAVALLRALA